MNDKEVEKKLQESADNIETRDFSLVWKDIKQEIEPQRIKKKNSHWLPLAASAASIVVACSIIIPIALAQNQPQVGDESSSSSEQVYLIDELSVVEVTTEEFFTKVTLAGIDLVDVSDYIVAFSTLFETQDAIVKGGKLELTDDLENSTFFLRLDFYDQSVTVGDQEVEYDLNYSVNDIMIEYRIQEAIPEGGIYIYDIKANVNTVNYYLEYTCLTEDIKPFLDEFFK